MGDLPTGSVLLSLARDVLLNDLLPLLPPESRLDARLVANSMAIAEREGLAGNGAMQEILGELTVFYAGEGEPRPLHRLARDLRAGALDDFEPRAREARAILWRLTIAKLRQANPRFLAANGLR